MPASTLLIRAVRAPTDGARILTVTQVPASEWQTTGLVTNPPAYNTGKYSTCYCTPTRVELDLYKVRPQRYDPPLQDTCKYLLGKLNLKPPEDDEFWGDWIENLIETNEQTLYLDMIYHAEYKEKAGFKFSLDVLHNTPNPTLYGGMISLNPPGLLYRLNENEVDDSTANVVSMFDWNSPIRSI
jgi:hypothetical protein